MSTATTPVDWSSLTAPERIRLLLLSKRVTSRRLAECMNWELVQAGESGITENAVSNYLRGVRPVPEWLYKHAAALLDIDERELLDAPAIRPSVSASLGPTPCKAKARQGVEVCRATLEGMGRPNAQQN